MKTSLPRFLPRLSAILLCALPCCQPPKIEYVSGSAHIQAILRDLSEGALQSHNLVPPASCPGHCDMRPSDVAAVAGCAALFIHPWQRNMANVQSVLDSSKLDESRIHLIDVPGNWMAPPVQAQAVALIADTLARLDPERAAPYAERARQRTAAILAFGAEQTARLKEARAAETKVLCAEILAPFIEWAGFDVVATFGRAEDLSVADMEALIRAAGAQGVSLVIDNLQSGDAKTGKAVADDLGVAHVVLSNFPGGFERTNTWESAFQRNIDLLLDAAAQTRRNHE